MATKKDFIEEEWEAMQKGVTGAGMLVSISDRGFLDTFKEAGSLAKHVAKARESTSEVVRELANVRGSGFGLTSSPEEIESETLAALRSAVSTLEAKAPEVLDEYRSLVTELAEAVAKAAGGGDAAETGAIAKIRSALGEAAPA